MSILHFHRVVCVNMVHEETDWLNIDVITDGVNQLHYMADVEYEGRALSIDQQFPYTRDAIIEISDRRGRLIGSVEFDIRHRQSGMFQSCVVGNNNYRLEYEIEHELMIIEEEISIPLRPAGRHWIHSSAIAENSAGRIERRAIWGAFWKSGAATWWHRCDLDTGGSLPLRYEEVRINGDFVELRSSSGTIRIYNEGCFIKSGSEFELLYRGRWITPSQGGFSLDDSGSPSFFVPWDFDFEEPPSASEGRGTTDEERQNRREQQERAQQRAEEDRREIDAFVEALRNQQSEQDRLNEERENAREAERRRRIEKELQELRRQQEDRAALSSIADTLADARRFRPQGGQTQCNHFVAEFAQRFAGRLIPELTHGSRRTDNYQANQMFDRFIAQTNIMRNVAGDRWKRVEEYGDLQEFGRISSTRWRTSREGIKARLQYRFDSAQKAANEGRLVIVAWRNTFSSVEGEREDEHLPDSGHVGIVVPSQTGGLAGPSGHWDGLRMPFIAQAGTSVFAHKGLSYGFGREIARTTMASEQGEELFRIWVYTGPVTRTD